MSLRLMAANKSRICLFQSVSKLSLEKRSALRYTSSACKPSVPWLEKPSVIFSAKAVNHHWGAIPIIIITAVGLTLEFIALTRLAFTRDDVYFTKTAACDIVETRQGYKAPIRKLIVFNQKYENPPGLIKALQGDLNSVPVEEKVDEGVNKKIIAAHAISSLGVLYLATMI